VFALVFTVMAAFVVAITMSAARTPRQALLTGSTTAASARQVTPESGGSLRVRQAGARPSQQAGRPAAGDAKVRHASARLDALLAAALRPVLRAHPGQVAVGVIDTTTGGRALYDATRYFRSARIATADILAALLWQHQHAGTTMTSHQADQAAAMIDDRSAAAATSLWRAVGGAAGLTSANRELGLTHTIPGAGGAWARTRITVADELQLLTDLTSVDSPLSASARDYELRLLSGLAAGQPWGATAAASGRDGNAVMDAWLPDQQLWIINTIGVVEHDGQVLLITVLSARNGTEVSGIALVSDAAVAAADVVTRAGN
jgi:hypothetical protein